MNRYIAEIGLSEDRKFFIKDCPHGAFYEAINRHYIRILGSNNCRRCRFFSAIKKEDGKVIVYCRHEEGKEIIPQIKQQ